jgi:hypothetical protein
MTSRRCARIRGATRASYGLRAVDVGMAVRVSVTAKNKKGLATAVSAPTAVIGPAPTASPPPVALSPISRSPASPGSAGGTDIYSRPVPRFGVSPGYTIISRSSAMQDFELNQIVAVGAKLIRLDYPDPARADVVIAKAIARGLEPALVIGATIPYASRPSLSTFQSRCAAAATKYRGTIRYYEPMNEPNIKGWPPADFVQYQRACYNAIKQVDSRNLVFMAGIAPTANGTNANGTVYAPVTWTQQVYANGGKGSFDLMNVHLYGDPAVQASWSVWCQTFGCGTLVNPSIKQVMAANGDSKPVVSTESGENALKVGETVQAAAVSGSLHLRHAQHRLGLRDARARFERQRR